MNSVTALLNLLLVFARNVINVININVGDNSMASVLECVVSFTD